jgi:hypothetical protein
LDSLCSERGYCYNNSHVWKAAVAWSRVYHIYYNKSRRLSLSSSGRKARYLSYIQNSYALVHSIGTPSITSCSVVPPSCPALSTVSVVVAAGPEGSVPIDRDNAYGPAWPDRGPVEVAVRLRVRSSEFQVGVMGQGIVRVRGVTHLPHFCCQAFSSFFTFKRSVCMRACLAHVALRI